MFSGQIIMDRVQEVVFSTEFGESVEINLRKRIGGHDIVGKMFSFLKVCCT